MQRLFFGFPRGFPGVALLLMRAVIGLALLIQGGDYVREPAAGTAALVLGLTAFLDAALLIIGFLTPLAAFATATAALGIWLSLLPATTSALFNSRASSIFAITIVIAILALGPGAVSVDARLFGRREIIFPPPEL
jgi:uncharacterized membrane protein YphA (DoxX/SURF4 family)